MTKTQYLFGFITLFFSIHSMADSDEITIKGALTNHNKCTFDKQKDKVICDNKTLYKKTTNTTIFQKKTNEIKKNEINSTLVNTKVYVY